MVVNKTHLFALLFLMILAIAYFAQRAENAARDKLDQEEAIQSCIRNVTRDSYEAHGFLVLAERTEKRDAEAAALYRATADSVARTIPRPPSEKDSLRMVQVERITGPDEAVRFELTAETKELQEAGCRHAFGE